MKDRALLPYYLAGRTAAQEEFESGDFDAAAIAEEIPSTDHVHSHCMKVMEEHLRSGEIEGGRRAWFDDHEEECTQDGVDPGDAYRVYCKGYIDESIPLLEVEVVTALEDLVDEGDEDGDNDSETRPNPTTYAEWDDAGVWDAEQSFDSGDMDEELKDAVALYEKDPAPLAEYAKKAVDDYWKAQQEDDAFDHFQKTYSEQLGETGHNPERAFKRWRDGWKGRVVKYVKDEIEDRAAGAE